MSFLIQLIQLSYAKKANKINSGLSYSPLTFFNLICGFWLIVLTPFTFVKPELCELFVDSVQTLQTKNRKLIPHLRTVRL